MSKWMNGIYGAVLVVFLWIAGWSIGFGGLIEAFVDPDGEILDVWPVAMAIPGVIGGFVYAVLLLTASRGRGFHQVPVVRHIAYGALAGLAVGTVAAVRGIELTLTTIDIFAIATALGIVSALASAAFFRLIMRWSS